MYDIIGDVHGHADKLKSLLTEMDYQLIDGTYKHATRKAVFVGDFINRGPKIRETVWIIRKMVENGSALAILGNHELNAILFSLRDKAGRFTKKHSSENRLALNRTLSEFDSVPKEWEDHLKWMRSLPLFLDLGPLRIVHAYWNDEHINNLKVFFSEGKLRKKQLREIARNNSPIAQSLWETCKGIEFKLPKDLLIFDSTGQAHRSFRMKWWINPAGKTFKEISYESRFKLPGYTIPAQITEERPEYPVDAPLVFFGHYCSKGKSGVVAPNLCCVDSCVTRTGKLRAYRWQGESVLDKSHIISVL